MADVSGPAGYCQVVPGAAAPTAAAAIEQAPAAPWPTPGNVP
ncbi:hypothetical protein [Nocardia nova]|nr:hypothetical protein [Nocardia nova]